MNGDREGGMKRNQMAKLRNRPRMLRDAHQDLRNSQ